MCAQSVSDMSMLILKHLRCLASWCCCSLLSFQSTSGQALKRVANLKLLIFWLLQSIV
jgi:hypothetical protein